MNKKQKTKKSKLLILLEIFMILASIFAIYEIFLLGPIEKVLRYIIIGIFLIIDIIFIFRIRKKQKTKEKKKLLVFFLILYIILNIAIGILITYIYGKIDNINKEYVTYSSSLVTMKESGMKKLSDIKEITIGIINDKTSPDGYIIPMEIIKEKNLKDENTIKKYDDYNSMLSDLYSGEIGAIFINSDYRNLYSTTEAYSNIDKETNIVYSKEKKILKANTSKRETASAGKSIKDPFTILLMGVDSTDEGLDKNTVANGDSLILITFNPHTLNATMISIPRDSYVPIACWSGKPENKITHAAAYGTDCMMSTIEEYFDITIDYYAKINFRGLVSLVDTLGGIDVEVPQDLCTDNSNREKQVCIKQGFQHLNGEEALVLARNRKQLLNGDLDRGLNQQIVIQGLVNKVKDMKSIKDVNSVLNTISNNLDTNFTTEQILSFYDIAKDIMANSLQKDDADLINIEQLFLDGTGQMIYDERSRMVLWDYVPNPQSQEDIINAMKVNLEKEEPELIKEFSFSINAPYEKTIVGTGPYTSGYDYSLVPNFVGYSKAQAEAMANKAGVRVSFSGSGGYVTSQSFPANKRTDLVKGTIVLTLSGGLNSSTSNNSSSNSNSNSNSTSNKNSGNSSNNNGSSSGSSSGSSTTTPKEESTKETEKKEVPVETEDEKDNKKDTNTDTPNEK